MVDTTAASLLASSLRQATSTASHVAYRSARPAHAAATGVNISSSGIDGSSSSIKFDASGQMVPTGTKNKKESATASAVDLFA
ncbi:MAG: hypothetical protein ABF893_04770 [Gluconacetobacter liquefaciens]|uniref:Uncharacterized protein n=1 Tax=Gluconacetobacter liquefaciens TaxID=89584 RepID=A0A370G6U6_GLULI|nr:hypothetical protein [Gluconacetobacter liquefaciens]MBB2185722.1 hypothetical protein [Gluconacetobacter liquefaciens]RDI39528.1 hypothetical protein C7453_102318 [Gluconacetobacter liquefaciens]